MKTLTYGGKEFNKDAWPTVYALLEEILIAEAIEQERVERYAAMNQERDVHGKDKTFVGIS